MSLSDSVRDLEAELATERKRRRLAENALDDIKDVLAGYSSSNCKPWGRTLDKIGKLVGVEVEQ